MSDEIQFPPKGFGAAPKPPGRFHNIVNPPERLGAWRPITQTNARGGENDDQQGPGELSPGVTIKRMPTNQEARVIGLAREALRLLLCGACALLTVVLMSVLLP